jgi:hypothetical protein
MKSFRVFAGMLASLALVGTAWAEVRTISPTQTLARPTDRTFTQFAQGIAIDGSAIIVLAAYEGGQTALLYRRSSGSSLFTYRRALLSVSGPTAPARVRMKNGIAAVQFGNRVSIFETVGGDYVPGRSAAPIQHPGGLAISGSSILIGGDNCDYDAVVYEKGADGNWGITGRMDDNQGECQPEGLAVELNYNYALLRVPTSNEATAWRRNSALAWVPAGSVTMPSDQAASYGPLALQNATAVTPGSFVFRRAGNTWTQQGTVVPADYGSGTGDAFEVKYRDGVLLTTERLDIYNLAQPYAYLETSPGQFEHGAVLKTDYHTIDHDVSGRTVVATIQRFGGQQDVMVFYLPTPLAAAHSIVNDFEERDSSDFTFNSGQFALATRGSDDVLAQTSTGGLSLALATDSDWTYFQRVEAHIAPTFAATGGWVGLVARYVDANNYYYVAIRRDNTFGLYRRLNGVETLLAEATSDGVRPSRVVFTVKDGELFVRIFTTPNNIQYSAYATDRSLPHGRAGLATYRAAADFDDVYIAAAEQLRLLTKEYHGGPDFPGEDYGRPFTEIGSGWQVQRDESGTLAGYAQRDTSRSAAAVIGAPVRNQDVEAIVAINAVSSQTAAWVGLLARYVDARTHYYVTLRANNRVEIRKRVNGAGTLLAWTNYTVTTGRGYHLRFRLIEDQLQLFVNGVLVARARDSEIPAGRHGLGTYLAAATWDSVWVTQP